jgi:uncharacterized membrane protein YfhO
VNGNVVPLLRANHGFQAVEVPKGQSTIELAYQDKSFQAGLVISAGGWLACLGAMVRFRRGAVAV